MPDGADQYQKLRAAGFSQQDADQYKAQKTATLQQAGFGQKEIDDYWGDTQAGSPHLDALVRHNVASAAAADAKLANPDNPIDMLAAGWDMSSTSLMFHAPKTLAPEHVGLVGKISSGLGQLAGDLPESLVGMMAGGSIGGSAGGAAGALVPGAGETGTSEAVGAGAGAMFGAGAGGTALPEAIRQVKLDSYANGEFLSTSDFLKRSAHMAWETTKSGAIGGISAFVGGKAGAGVLSYTGSKTLGGVSSALTYAGTSSLASAGMEGRAPNRDDFVTGALLALGFHGLSEAIPKAKMQAAADLQGKNYVDTGIHPHDQAQAAKVDPEVSQELYQHDADLRPVNPRLRALASPEPEPFRQPDPAAPPFHSGADLLTLVRHLEGSADDAISKAQGTGHGGAVGRFQIMPKTAIQYGFDPARLKDPDYNTKVATAILNDLAKRYRKPDGTVDVDAVLVAYNAGPGRANSYIASGRKLSSVLPETQKYLAHADRLGAFGKDWHYDAPPAEEGAGGGDNPTRGKLVVKMDGEVEMVGGGDGGEPPKPPSGPGANADDFSAAVDKMTDPLPKQTLLQKLAGVPYAMQYAVTELAPFMKLDRNMKLDPNELTMTDMFRSTYASGGRAYHMINWGTVDPVSLDKTSNLNLMDTYKSAMAKGGGSLDEFMKVRLALRTVELAGRGIKTGLPLDSAKEYIAANAHKYILELDSVRKVNDAKVDYLRKSGMLSDAQAQHIKDQNQHWVPLARQIEDVGDTTYTHGSRFGPRQPLKGIEGSDKKIANPIASEIASFYAAAANADKNRAVQSIVEVMRAHADLTSKGEVALKVTDADPAELNNTVKRGDNSFTYFDKGVLKKVEVSDPLLAQTIRGATPIEVPVFLRSFATLARIGIVEMPDFAARVLLKDATTSALLAKHGGVPFFNTLRGAAGAIGQDAAFKDFVAKGGFGMALQGMEARNVKAQVDDLQASGAMDKLINVFKHPVNAWTALMQTHDSIGRNGYYQKLKAEGIDPQKAAMMARKYSLDYGEKSGYPLLNFFAGMIPFFRASVLQSKQTAEAWTERPVTTSVKHLAFVALPMAILYAMNVQQDEKDGTDEVNKFVNLPEWQTDNHYVFPAIGGVRVRIPTGFGSTSAIGAMTNRFMKYLYTHDKEAFKGLTGEITKEFTPPILPNVALPVAEQIANKSFFTGTPLVPKSLEDAHGELQYTPATSEVAKKLTVVLGPEHMNVADVSPIVVDNYVREWSGTLGSAAMHVLDAPLGAPGKPTDLANAPFFGSFVMRNPGMSAQPISDYYDMAEEFNKAQGDLALSKKRGEMQGQSLSPIAYADLSQTSTALAKMRAVANAITVNKDMTPDEKRQRLDDIYSGAIIVAKAGIIKMKAYKEAAHALP